LHKTNVYAALSSAVEYMQFMLILTNMFTLTYIQMTTNFTAKPQIFINQFISIYLSQPNIHKYKIITSHIDLNLSVKSQITSSSRKLLWSKSYIKSDTTVTAKL